MALSISSELKIVEVVRRQGFVVYIRQQLTFFFTKSRFIINADTLKKEKKKKIPLAEFLQITERTLNQGFSTHGLPM
jgi:hypothetical protein